MPLVTLDGEVEARVYDVKFTDIISMENNIGISAGFSTNITNGTTVRASALNLETVAYYQPSFKFNVLKDLSLKVGIKLGIGGALTFRFGKCTTHKHYLSPSFVDTLVLGAEYKNIIVETELGPAFRLNVGRMVTKDSCNCGSDEFLDPLPTLKIKAGYRF